MAIVVEDGTGLANANSYASVAVADAYFLSMGKTAWAGPDTEKEIRTLDITAACGVNGDLTITLNGVAFTVAVTTALDTAAKVAGVIRAATFTGWVITGADAQAIFTAIASETRSGAYSFAPALTLVTGTLAQTQAGSVAAKESALVRATRAIDGLYAGKWPGIKASSTQALAWPRSDAYDIDGFYLSGVPLAIGYATCEAALIELGSAGSLSVPLDRGGAIISETVGPLSTTYADNAPAGTVYNTIRQALSTIVPIASGSIRFARA